MTNKTAKKCVAVAAKTMKESLVLAKESEALADVIEIRLDTILDPVVTDFTNSITTPLLFTNRASWEGGHFSGDEEERLALLHEAINAKAAYVDIELNTEESLQNNLIKKAKTSKTTKSIVSWHDFKVTPSNQGLQSILQKQYRSGADIGKIVTMANSHLDVLRVLNLQALADEIGFPLIAFCMGSQGVISRVATCALGGIMTYASPDSSAGTAPGQLPITSLNKILTELENAD